MIKHLVAVDPSTIHPRQFHVIHQERHTVGTTFEALSTVIMDASADCASRPREPGTTSLINSPWMTRIDLTSRGATATPLQSRTHGSPARGSELTQHLRL